MDERCKKLLNHIWNYRPGGLLWEKSLLVWNMLKLHVVEDVKIAVIHHNTNIAVIHGGALQVFNNHLIFQ